MNDRAPESCTLHVCTSCRPRGMSREPREDRPGYRLHKELTNLIDASPLRDRVTVLPAQCLSLCPRPCGIALASPGAWSYLFGEQRVEETAGDILSCLELYLDSPGGLMPREQRPEALRASVLGRVPPTDSHP